MAILGESELSLLREVVLAQAPTRLDLLEGAKTGTLVERERAELCQLVSLEFTATGLDGEDEPTSRGVALEELLDILNRPRIKA